MVAHEKDGKSRSLFCNVLAGKQFSEESPGLCRAVDIQAELKQSRSLIEFQTNCEFQIRANNATGQKVELLKEPADRDWV